MPHIVAAFAPRPMLALVRRRLWGNRRRLRAQAAWLVLAPTSGVVCARLREVRRVEAVMAQWAWEGYAPARR